ncbi:MAG: hydroxyacylglutathione hydrolase, partial [Sphingomonadales bacterium]|nr:hydroxyacylglutathione hydrolase [Sphingomonadales bacterium]
MRLTDEVGLIGSGSLGLGLSHPLDCHVYVLDGGDDLALVDLGTGLHTERMLELARADGYDLARLRHAFVTHPHADHAGGARSWVDATGLQVAAHPQCAAFIRAADEHGFNLDVARAAGRYPADYVLEPLAQVRELDDGEEMRIGHLRVRTIYTPGHSVGAACFFVQGRERSYLFTGDTLFYGGKVLILSSDDSSVVEL